MYAAHFAAAFALKGAVPHAPWWVLLVSAGLCDLVNGVLVAAGVERIRPKPDDPLGFTLEFIDWDHSLLMTGALALAFAAFFRRDRAVALAAFVAVLVRRALAEGVAMQRLAPALVVLAALHLSFSPWLSPMRLFARHVEMAWAATIGGTLTFVGFALPIAVLVKLLPEPLSGGSVSR